MLFKYEYETVLHYARGLCYAFSEELWSRALNRQGRFCPPGDIWQGLETLLVVMPRGEGLLSVSLARGQPGCSTPCNAQHIPLQPRLIQPQMSIAPRLRNSGLESSPLSLKLFYDLSIAFVPLLEYESHEIRDIASRSSWNSAWHEVGMAFCNVRSASL